MPLVGKPTADFKGHGILITFPAHMVVHNHTEYSYDLGDRITENYERDKTQVGEAFRENLLVPSCSLTPELRGRFQSINLIARIPIPSAVFIHF